MSRSSRECFSAAHPQGSFKPRGVFWGLLSKKTSSTRLQNVSLEPTPSVTWPRSPSRGHLENFTCGQTIWIRFPKGSPTCKGRGSSAGLVSSLCVSQHSGALNFSLERHLSLHAPTLIQANLSCKRNQIQEPLLSSAPDGNCSMLIIQSGTLSDHLTGENVRISNVSPVLRLDHLGLFSDASSQRWTSTAK